ncbi:MAG TPA: dienelactone hydrolase family protein [Pirellulales bacterium]|nr:dienelactone hydrolase family protein [Pirellulales bacterium]
MAAVVIAEAASAASVISAGEPLPGTAPLEMEGDLADAMVAGIDRFLLNETAASVAARAGLWRRDFSSAAKYQESVAPNRARLAKILGAADPREKIDGLEFIATTSQPALVGRGEGYEAYAVRWRVLPGVHGEGLLLKPNRDKPLADIVAIPDADQTPEMLAGLAPGIEPEAQFARRLAESGCRVVIPALLDRADTYSISAGGARPTNQPHREFIYRQAFEMGRHLIGYEVQKVLAVVDWFAAEAGPKDPAIGVFGYAEGGLLALSAAALDPRIDVTCVSGYFEPRENVWQEPIYRNVFALLHEFGDAELASLIAPRSLIVEASRVPEVTGPPAPGNGRSGAAPGRLRTPDLTLVKQELQRAEQLTKGLDPAPKLQLVASGEGKGLPGSSAALETFLGAFGGKLAAAGGSPTNLRGAFDPNVRLKRQLDEMTEYTQHLMREGEYTRRDFWAKADRGSRSVEKWQETAEPYRDYFYNDVVGRFDRPLLKPEVRSRKVYDEAKFTGYDVVMNVFPDVFAYGILLLPKDLKPGERRPVVVCQHGLEGRPQDVADPKINNPAYNQFALKLAERGFITYSPQNPYIFTDRFRSLQRKSNPLQKTLFSTIVPQHQQAVNWLASLPMVDPERIGFYGLSYGGKSAMRIPALVKEYCLSICSADFNEWIWKNTSTRWPGSYIGTGEYEIFEFDLGNTFNYAEMAGLIAPRPFMVERGHRDGVGPDEWVAYEYAKVRLLYADLKIPERTTIEFFDGPHTIHGVGTFAFLHQHLNWPEK